MSWRLSSLISYCGGCFHISTIAHLLSHLFAVLKRFGSFVSTYTNVTYSVSKSEVKRIGIEAGFADVAKQKESMGICFVGKRDLGDFLGQSVFFPSHRLLYYNY